MQESSSFTKKKNFLKLFQKIIQIINKGKFMKTSIGNISNATESQLISFYQQTLPEEVTQEKFVNEYKHKQEMALKDTEKLTKCDVTIQQIGEKLYRIVEIANTDYKSRLEKSISFLASDFFNANFEQPFIDVNENGLFRVSGFHLRMSDYEKCTLCNMEVYESKTYQIKNLQTYKKIRFSEMTMHCIKSHGYVPKSELYALDPSKASIVLDLNKEFLFERV